MGDKTKIEWTEASWNPIAAFTRHDLWIATGRIETTEFKGGEFVPAGTRGWFCTKVSPGCAGCYAEGINIRLGNGLPYTLPNLEHIEFRLVSLDQPIRWKRPRHIFVCSMCDIFHAAIPRKLIDQVFTIIAIASHHTFQVLTKRAKEMRDYFADADNTLRGRILLHGQRIAHEKKLPIAELSIQLWNKENWPLRNLLLGVSAEDQQRLDERFEYLLDTPAAARFLSCEPLLGRIDVIDTWRRVSDKLRDEQIISPRPVRPLTRDDAAEALHYVLHWIIGGGESGPRSRYCNLTWLRFLIEQGQDAKIPVFVKQVGARPIGPWPMAGNDGAAGDVELRQLGRLWASLDAPRFTHPKGGDPLEWPEDLRVREMPVLPASRISQPASRP